MNKKQAYDELAFIKKVMEDSQRASIDNGKIFILLSLLAILGVALKLFNDFIGLKINSLYVFIPLMAMGITCSFLSKNRMNAKMGGKTYASKIMDGIWVAFVISTSILCFVGSAAGGIQPMAVIPVIAVLFGINQYISGLLINFRWFSSVAYGWWISSICMFLWPGEHSVIFLGILLILFQFIPGLILFQNWKKRHHA
jgi:hypothetical protein